MGVDIAGHIHTLGESVNNGLPEAAGRPPSPAGLGARGYAPSFGGLGAGAYIFVFSGGLREGACSPLPSVPRTPVTPPLKAALKRVVRSLLRCAASGNNHGGTLRSLGNEKRRFADAGAWLLSPPLARVGGSGVWGQGGRGKHFPSPLSLRESCDAPPLDATMGRSSRSAIGTKGWRYASTLAYMPSDTQVPTFFMISPKASK